MIIGMFRMTKSGFPPAAKSIIIIKKMNKTLSHSTTHSYKN
jgi:hypothetical protein